MGLAGEGAVAIWHDIAPEGREGFYAWHGEEHMPERVAIPGFLRGRRYVALDADLEFFNLYEARTPEVVTGRDYRQRLDHPTPWTVATVRHFRNVARAICRVAASRGRAEGGLVLTARYEVAAGREDEHRAALVGRVLPELAAAPGVAGAHLLVADVAASRVDSAERRARGAANLVPPWIILVEGWGDAAPLAATGRQLLSAAALGALGASGPALTGLYRLQVTLTAAAPAG
jgi:hypothetical protein